MVTGRASRLSGGETPERLGAQQGKAPNTDFPTVKPAMRAPRESQRSPWQVPQPESACTLCLELDWAQHEGEGGTVI